MTTLSTALTGSRPSIPGFGGDLITPGDPAYERARSVFNGSIDRRPGLIARPRSAADVQAALRHALGERLPFAVRAGGHSLAGFSMIDDGLVIDLRGLKGTKIDPRARRGRFGAGLIWGELDAATQEHGLAVTGGRISDTGVAGLTLGSGSGWLERRHGLTSDSLRAARVVTAGGDLISVDEHQHPDLFWGLRGGGGNFGIVTEFEFELHPVGSTVYGGMLLFSWERAAETLAAYRDVMEAADDDLGGCAAIVLAPPAPFVPEELVGEPVLSLAVAAFGGLERAERLAAPLRKLGPLVDMVEPMPYVALQQMLDEGTPAGLHGKFEASFMDSFPDAAISELVDFGGRMVSPHTQVLIQPLGGAYSRIPAEETALAHRDAPWMYHALSMWADEADTERNVTWTDGLVAALAPFARRGVHPNHVSSDRQERVRSFYGAATYDRLVAVKDRWDPANVFSRNQNILPSR